MRILHVTHGFFPEGAGGVESYLRDVILAQRADGHDARLLTGSHVPWPEAGLEEVELEGIPAWRVHRDDLFFDHFAKLWHPGVGRLFAGVLEEFQPDVVHVHQWIRLTCDLVEIAEERGVPTVVTLHDLYTSCPRCFRVRPDDEHCERTLSVASCVDCVPRYGHESDREIATSIELFRDQYASEVMRARAVLVASRATADLVTRTTPIDPARITLLPLAYRPRFDGVRAAPPVAGEPLRFGYWGNLTARKGVPVLVRAFRELMATAPSRPVELHLFGKVDTDALDAELRAIADGLPVTFHGRFEYADLIAARLHCAVFPMVCFETYGFVLDEAFELGLPAVVTDVGAIPTRAGDAAVRVAPRDVAGMAAALGRVVEEAGLLEQLRQAIAPVGLTLAEHVLRLTDLYREARDAAPRAPGDPSLPRRRAELLLLQRETALRPITPDGGPR